MKPSIPILSMLALILFAACSSPRMATSTEYDDIYYSSSDRTTPAVSNADRQNVDRQNVNRQGNDVQTYTRDSYESYNDAYYAEDDFHYSRRLRRFHNNSSNSWRYYDPFYSNDLYYVMGTPHWSRWNNNGWYNWNRPRFGASFGWGSPFYASPWGYGSMNNFGYWNSFNYYNPWVNTYYGYDPFFGYSGFGPALGYGNGFNNFGYGYYGGFGYGAAYYCPPGYGGYGGFASVPDYQRFTTQHRNSTRTTSSQSSFTPSGTRVRESGMNTPGSLSTPTTVTQNGAPVNRSDRYLSPRPQSELVEARSNAPAPAMARPGRSTTTSPTTTPNNVYTRPERSTSPTVQPRNNDTQARPNVYTRPGSTSHAVQQRETAPATQNRPNVYTRPGATETPSRQPRQPERRNH